MKTIETFLSELIEQNIKLRVEGDKLRIHAPKGALTPELRAELAERKAEVIQFLQERTKLDIPPIQPMPQEGEQPLSFAQQRLWFLDQLEGENVTYNMPAALRLEGPLHRTAFEQSLREIVQRHETLRTTFSMVNGEPVPVIHQLSVISYQLSVISYQALPAEEQATQVQKFINKEAQLSFELSKGPLFRTTLLELGSQSHVLFLNMHHIISDEWSIGVFIRELSTLYEAFSQGQSSPLPPLPIQYTDFAHWQRQWLTGEVLDKQINYWKKQLAGAPALLELPTDFPRPAVQRFRGQSESFQLDVELSGSLKRLSQQTETTSFMVFLSAFAVLLSRYSGQLDLVIGYPMANRTRREIESLIGFFVNTLVLRFNLEGNPRFDELLGRVKSVALEAQAHQDLPFEQLVEELKPERNLSYMPLFQVALALQNAQRGSLELSGLTLTPIVPENTIAKFDLTLFIDDSGDEFSGEVEYNTDLFSNATIRRMISHFQTLLEGIVANPSQSVQKLPLLTKAEQQQLLAWNDTATDYPHDKCIHQQFEAQVLKTPEATAVVFESQQLTYRELNRKANQLAHYLQTVGVKNEVLVGISIGRSLEMVIGLLGILKAGGAYLPLDISYPSARLAFMLEDAQVSVLLTQNSLVEKLPSHHAQVVCLDTDWEKTLFQQSENNPDNKVKPDNLAYVNYTSGSTGQPKGVEVLHRGVIRLLFGVDYVHLDANQIFLQMAPVSFDASTLEIWGALLHGARCVLFPGDIPTSQALNKVLQTDHVNILWLTAALFNSLIDESPEILSGVRQLLVGGEALSVNHIRRAIETLPNTQLINGYGPTENTTFTCCYPIPSLLGKSLSSIPIGRPIGNTQVSILDVQLQPTPIGVPGELHIGGAGLARGYLNRPELTQEKFIANPFFSDDPEVRLYKTGDLVRYLSDGNIEFIGRIDNQVKVRGFRIELGEIEAVLTQHPSIKESVVVLDETSAGEKRLIACLVSKQGQMNTGELRRFIKERLPDYMVPSFFVPLDVIPLTPNGKVDRHALHQLSVINEQSSEEQFVAPRTPEEEMVAGIMAEVLGLKQVGIYDNFFDLGGHSLLATQVISRVRDTFSIELPLRDLFEFPTIANLGERLAVARHERQLPPIKPIARTDDLPLSFGQQRLWFLYQLEGPSATYNIPAVLRLVGTLHRAALEEGLTEMVRRHESLRTTFATVSGKPHQVIHQGFNPIEEVVDLQPLAAAEQSSEIQRLAQEEAQRPFYLAKGPLVRATLLKLNAEEHLLLFSMHHIISDGWSIGVTIQELSSLYNAFYQGQPSPLPALPIQYADFANWQRQWLTGEVLEAQINYWRQQLTGVPALLEMPTDYPRPAIQSYQGATQAVQLTADLIQQLKKLSQQTGTTLFMTLLSAFAVLFSRYSGMDDIVIGSPIANRTQSQTEKIIGFFVNTLIFRIDLEGNPNVMDLLKRVRRVALDAYTNQDIPFEQLVEELQPVRSLSHSPLFQVMFALQNMPTGSVELAGLSLTPLEPESATTQFDISLSMEETSLGLVGTLEYSTDLFEAATIERMFGHFKTLLAGMVANPQQPIHKLPLLTEAEQQQLLAWNDTAADYPRDKTLVDLFEAQVEKTPEAIAVVFEGQQLTYRELNSNANQVAHYLRRVDITRNKFVGILEERNIDFLAAMLGILKAGGAFLPIDPNYPDDRVRYMVTDSQIQTLITRRTLFDKIATDVVKDKHLRHLLCFDGEKGELEGIYQFYNRTALANEPKNNPTHLNESTDIAYMLYTSGSTGLPKGTMVRHNGAVNHIYAQFDELAFHQNTAFLQSAPSSSDISVWQFLAPLLIGGRTVIVDFETVCDPVKLFKVIKSQQVTLIELVPVVMQAILEQVAQLPPSDRALPALEWAMVTGEAVSAPLVNQWLSTYPNIKLVNAYGPTEAADDICQAVFDKPLPKEQINVSIGKPLANLSIYVLDRQQQLLPIGVCGEICVSGIGVGAGYWRNEKQTRASFVNNPYADDPYSNVIYRTGDLGRWLPDGSLEFIGRLDHQVKIRGFRIELGEIEAALGQYPFVKENVVVVHEDDSTGKRLVAFCVPEPEQVIDNTELRGFLKERLPDYMIPSAFVTLEEALPLTPNGKVDRRALSQLSVNREVSEEQFVAPRTPEEKGLADIWADVLGVERVGVYDNFFELGGDSIISIQVISRANQANLQLTPRLLFQHQTIAELATVVETGLSHQAEQGLVTGAVPLTPSQHWFFEQNFLEPYYYNQSVLLEVSPSLTPAYLEQIVPQLLQHHDMLRLRASVNHELLITDNCSLITEIIVKDLSELTVAQQRTTIESTSADLQASLNLSEGPLLRVALFQLGNEQPNRLLFVIHHIVIDGVSWRILLEDVTTAYQHLSRGEAIKLPPKTTSFKQWAQRVTEYAQSEALAAELDYWLIESRLNVAPLPVDFPSNTQANTVASSAEVSVSLSVEQTGALLTEVPQAYQTQINDVLLTALVQSFARWTGEPTLLIGLEGHGREEIFEDIDISRTLGWFTSEFPVLLDIGAVSNREGEALKSVKEQLRKIPNWGIGYGLLRYVNPETAQRLQALPQAEVSFNYLGQVDQMADRSSPSEKLISGLAQESMGAEQSPLNHRDYLLDVTGMIVEGKLTFDWIYSKNIHNAATIEPVAHSFIEALKALIVHCRSLDVQVYTPSDFPEIDFNQDELDELLDDLDED